MFQLNNSIDNMPSLSDKRGEPFGKLSLKS